MTRGPIARFIARSVGWVRPYRGHTALIALGLVLEAAFTASVPLAFMLLIDRAIVPRDTDLLLQLLTALTVGVVVVAAAGLGRDYLYAHLCSRILRDLRLQMFDHVQSLAPGEVAEDDETTVVAHFATDLSAIEHALVAAVPWALLPALDVVIGTTLLFVLEWKLALIAALVFPVSLIGPRLVAPRATRASYQRKQLEADVLGEVNELLAVRPMVGAFGLEQWIGGRFARRIAELTVSTTRTGFLSALVERSAGIGILFLQVVVVGVGGLMAFDGQLTIGTLVSFQSLFMTVSWSLSYVTQYVPNLVLAAGGLQRIDELMAVTPKVRDAPTAQRVAGLVQEIRFDEVVFGFADKPPVLDGLTFALRPNQFVAIVGPIGSGKSTALRLLARFVDPQHGRVTIDGHDLRQITQASLRQLMGVVFQDNRLIDVSIRDNIRLGKLDATDSEVEAAASLVGLQRVVDLLPQGYDTMVGTRGEALSGGQRQLVGIARAIIRDPAILLLDEPTSALDAESDLVVRLAIDLVSRGRTVVVVTHDLSLAVAADRVLVLNAGRLAEDGTHHDLLSADGLYARLWDQQRGAAPA